MFSVFASKDRRANYELLLFIYDTFTEMYYNALVESNKILYRKKRLLRYIDKKKITIDQYEKVLMALCKAKTEEDLNAILANALNSIIHHN